MAAVVIVRPGRAASVYATEKLGSTSGSEADGSSYGTDATK